MQSNWLIKFASCSVIIKAINLAVKSIPCNINLHLLISNQLTLLVTIYTIKNRAHRIKFNVS